MKKKNNLLKQLFFLIPIYLFVYLLGDIFFSNFIYLKSVKYGCMKKFEYYYELEKNCKSHEKLIGGVPSYKVYTDENGYRYSGKNKKKTNDNIVVFIGDSYTYGWGLDYHKTFVGIIENLQDKYYINNLAVPSYSPTVYLHQIKKIKENLIYPKKIFLVLDQTDAMNEANRWMADKDAKPKLYEKITNKKKDFWKDFRRKNLKGTRIFAMNLNSFLRNIRYKIENKENFFIEPRRGSFWADFIHTDWEKLDEDKNWSPNGIAGGLKKIEEKIFKISMVAKEMNSEFYIVIYPWADTLSNGQKVFNWENFANKICNNSHCNEVINLFPEFLEYKSKNKNWTGDLFLKGDPHWTEKSHKIVADKIIKYF